MISKLLIIIEIWSVESQIRLIRSDSGKTVPKVIDPPTGKLVVERQTMTWRSGKTFFT
jgi:hypothetical protein